MGFNFGENLKTLRKSRDLTQEQLAEFFCVSSQAVSKWETSASSPDISLLPVIANFFGVSTDELLGVDISQRMEVIADLCRQADELSAQRRYQEEVTLMQDALLRYPGNDQLMYRLAWALTGTIREHWENLDEAIAVYLKILEISTDMELRAKVTRDLMYRYYTRNDRETAMRYADQLPAFDVCREYNLGRSNLLGGKELADCLKANIQLYGNAMMECLEYFEDERILSREEMAPYTSEEAKAKMDLLRQILG